MSNIEKLVNVLKAQFGSKFSLCRYMYFHMIINSSFQAVSLKGFFLSSLTFSIWRMILIPKKTMSTPLMLENPEWGPIVPSIADIPVVYRML